MNKKVISIFILILGFCSILTAEMSFNSIIMDYGRTMQLIGEMEGKTLNYHSYSSDINYNIIESGPWKSVKIKDPIVNTSLITINILSPELWTSWNSATACPAISS